MGPQAPSPLGRYLRAVAEGPEPIRLAIVDDYEQAQLQSLKAGLLGAAVIALVSLTTTGGLPSGRPEEDESPATVSAGTG